MTSEVRFHHVIRTCPEAQPLFPTFVETVEQAIDSVQELRLDLLQSEPWQVAFDALWAALDYPRDGLRLFTANAALCAALHSEGWLDRIGPS